jgi:hypothetical protein
LFFARFLRLGTAQYSPLTLEDTAILKPDSMQGVKISYKEVKGPGWSCQRFVEMPD